LILSLLAVWMRKDHFDALFDTLVADAYERPLPELTPRAARLPWLKGKADAVVGMRRSGKTSFALQTAAALVAAGRPRESILYVSFDDERLDGVTAADLGRLLDAYYRRWPELRDLECALFFDEIQAVPGWERFVRRVIDTENAHVCLTGSSAKLLSTEVATTMRGRALTTEIFPFSARESLVHAGVDVPRDRPGKRVRSRVEHHIDRYLRVGGFPEAQGLEVHLRVQLLQGYLDLVILRDVIERHAISNPIALRRFVRQIMNAPGGLVSIHRTFNDLRSQGIAVSKDALHAFLDHLTDAYLFFALPIATESERVRQSNPRKLYCVDPGMVTACSAKMSPDVGFLLETVVFLALRRRTADLAYMRTKDGQEGDFVARTRDGLELVQACAELGAPDTRQRELSATVACMRELGLREATLVTLREEASLRVETGRIRVVPVWLWLLEQG